MSLPQAWGIGPKIIEDIGLKAIPNSTEITERHFLVLLSIQIINIEQVDFLVCTFFDTASSAAPESEDAAIKPKTIATLALAVRVRRSNHSARSHPLNRRDFMHLTTSTKLKHAEL